MATPHSLEAETPLLPADHTHFSSAKPHWKPGYARGKSEPDAFLHWPADARRSSSILCCELFRSSFFSFGILFYQSTTFLTRCAVWSLGVTPSMTFKKMQTNKEIPAGWLTSCSPLSRWRRTY